MMIMFAKKRLKTLPNWFTIIDSTWFNTGLSRGSTRCKPMQTLAGDKLTHLQNRGWPGMGMGFLTPFWLSASDS
jgi:hypothetical protein